MPAAWRIAAAVLIVLGLAACSSYELERQRFMSFNGRVVDQSANPADSIGIIVWAEPPGQAPITWEGQTESNGEYKVDVEWFEFADYYVLAASILRQGGPETGKNFDQLIEAAAYREDVDVPDISITLSQP